MKENALYWAKIKEKARIPYKRMEDAGYDIYPCFEEDYIVILPQETKKIPTGIASAFHASKVAILKERGSTGSIGIGQRSGVIDSGYRGEWIIPLTNHGTKPIILVKEGVQVEMDGVLYPYEKAICQAVFFNVPVLEQEEITYDALLQIPSQRMMGGFGSSGK